MAPRSEPDDVEDDDDIEEAPEPPKTSRTRSTASDRDAEAKIKKWVHDVLDERESAAERPVKKAPVKTGTRREPPKRTVSARSVFSHLFGG